MLVRDHFVVVRFFLLLFVSAEELEPYLLYPLHPVGLLELLEHEGMLDVALLYVLGEDVELVTLVEVLLLLGILPKRVGFVPCRLYAQIPEQIGEETLPNPLYLLNLPIDKVNQLIRRLLQSPKQMPQTIIHSLVHKLPTNHINAHAPQRILGIKIKRQILTNRINLISRERENGIVLHRIRAILHILQSFIHLHIDHYINRLILRG